MLRARHRGQAVDDLERVRIDDVDLAGHEIRRIDPRRLPGDSGAEHAGRFASVDIVRIDRRRHRKVGGRQKDRALGSELVGGKREKVAGRAALIVEAATNFGAIRRAEHTSVRNGERPRPAQPGTGANRDRDRRGCGQAVAKSHSLPFSIEPADQMTTRRNPTNETATATMTVR